MKPGATIKLVSQLIDLPIIDQDGRWCGIVDDVEFSGGAGKETRLKVLLVGPGAYKGRLPAWAFWLVRKIAGERMIRVPVEEIVEVGAVVKLKCSAAKLKLAAVEDKARRWVPRMGAM